MKTMHPTDLPYRRSWLFALLLLLCLPALAQNDTTVRASVDRQQLALNETVTLTVLVDSMRFSDEPDVTALEQDFYILNRQQSSRSSFVNGKVSSSRQWDYTLAPKREGDLNIPALPVGKLSTRPITVSVGAAPERPQTGSEQVYLEADVTPRRGYVQGELQYSIRIFTSVNFLEASLEPLEVDGAVVQEHGEERYQTTIDGRYYQVIERRYSLYPQRSGQLEIPALTLQARVETRRRSMLDPGRLVVKRSSPIRVQVMPPADAFDGPNWLPARALSISDNLSDRLDDVEVGDSITRTVTIKADGLLGSQLPTLPPLVLSNAKLYPDQAKVEKLEDGEWTALRQESVAIIPTRPGEYRLPEIRIPWWNTETNQQEVTILPERRFTVAPGATPLPPDLPRGAQTTEQSAAPVNTGPSAPPPRWLYLAIAVLLLGNIGFALAWWRARPHSRPVPTKATPKVADHGRAFKHLKQACTGKADAATLRRALLDWAAAATGQPLSLQALARRCPPLAPYCQALDASLYGEASPKLDRKALLAAASQCRPQLQQAGEHPQTSALSPLYD